MHYTYDMTYIFMYPCIFVVFQSITSTSVIERGKNIVSTSRDGAAKLWKVGESRHVIGYKIKRDDI